MNSQPNTPPEPVVTSITKYIWILATVWTVVIVGILAWHLWQNRQVTEQRAIAEARANFNKDQAFRYWATAHGGIYVPIDERTPPNPYLAHIPERDIETPSGKKLTLMNPAYMVRQMNEEFGDLYGVVGHITSLKVLRPENAPDNWERAALLAFEQGENEVLEFTHINDAPYLRLMQPMVTQAGCLKCHGHQGYEVGDVRGGVAVALPLTPLLVGEEQTNVADSLTLGLVWLFGLGGLVISGRSLNHRIRERDQALINLQQVHQLQATTLEQFKALIGNLQMGVLVETVDRRIIHSNQAFCDLFGIPTVEAILGLDCDAAAQGASALFQDPAQFLEDIGHILAAGQVVVNEELQLEDGRIFERDYVPVFLHSNFSGNMWLYRDVTERKQTEQAIVEHEERLRSLINSTPDIICFKDGAGRWLEANQADLELFSLTAVDYQGQTDAELAEFTHPIYRDAFLTCEVTDEQAWQAGDISRGEEIIPKPDGTKKIYDMIKVPIFETDGRRKGLVVLGRDITERKQMEQQLVQQERLAAVGQLAAGIAHDFNNILAAILGFTELLQLSPDTPETLQPCLEKISGSSRHAAHLVRQILDFSQKTVRQTEEIDLSEFAETSIQFLRSIIPENIQINLHIETGHYLINADATQLHQVITNLAINARDAMPKGGELRIELARVDGGGNCAICHQPIAGAWTQLAVSDTGSGIAADVLPRIFEPFFTTKEIGRGSGLGLSQVSGIVAQHGGHLRLESQVGHGSTFTIYLPPLVVQEKEAEATAQAAPLTPGHGKTILLVEDQLTVMEATTAMLEHLDYQVLPATSGAEAIALFEERNAEIGLVLSDMVMPDMDGAALFHRLKAVRSDLKMVVMSGYPLDAIGADLLKQGVVAWHQKPISLRQLAQAVDQALSHPSAV